MKRVHQYLNREQTNTIGKQQNGGGWRTRKRSKNTSQHKSTSWETHCAVTTFCQNVPQIIIMIIMTAVMINSALLTVIVLAWRDEWHYQQYQNLANQHLCLHSVFRKSPKPEKRKEPEWAFYAFFMSWICIRQKFRKIQLDTQSPRLLTNWHTVPTLFRYKYIPEVSSCDQQLW